MINDHSQLIPLLTRLWAHVLPHRRKQLGFLLILLVLVSFAEVLTIGAVLPFLAVLADPEKVFTSPSAEQVIRALNLTTPDQLLLPITVFFIVAVVTAGGMRFLLLWASTRLNMGIGADMGYRLYKRTLYQPFTVHMSRNSSDVIAVISAKMHAVVYQVVAPILILLSSIVLFVAILVVLFAIDPTIALSAMLGFGSIYGGIIWMVRNRLAQNGRISARLAPQVVKHVQEGLGGIRDVLLDGTQDFYANNFRQADYQMKRVQANTVCVSQFPRYGIEALGMALLAMFAFFLAQKSNGGFASAIPVLGALVIGAQRLLPVLQQAYSSWSNIQNSRVALADVLFYLDYPLPKYIDNKDKKTLPFEREITLKTVSFRYTLHSTWVFENVSLKVAKGSRIGFIGETGCGKSTLLDIVMGLLPPTEGVVVVDDQVVTSDNMHAWQAHVAHVPQDIFLADSTIAENISFGVPKEKINYNRVQDAAQRAHIAEVIESWDEKYDTVIGERGVRLSGGQRQRIGIARALYKQADVIIFDEATSALDNETEQSVMQAIEGLSDQVTILIIAHRLSTLRNCSQIVELANGGVKRTGTYQKIVMQADDTLNMKP